VGRREDEAHAGVPIEPRGGSVSGPHADVVRDDDDRSSPVVPDDVIEKAQDHRRSAIGRHLKEHAAVADIEGSEDVAGPLAFVLELQASRFSAAHRSSSARPAKRLNTMACATPSVRTSRQRTAPSCPWVAKCTALQIFAAFGSKSGSLGLSQQRTRCGLRAIERRKRLIDERPTCQPKRRDRKLSQRAPRPTRKCPAKPLRCLDNNRRELLPDVVLDFRGPAGTRTVAQAVEACFQVALDPAPDDLPIDRQAGADLVHLETVCRQQRDARAQYHEVLAAAATALPVVSAASC
jgi:hypothetical protein